MLAKLLLSVGIVFYAVAVPYLEINATHVFDPAWTPHAKLHEVWQLATNSAIGAVSFWLVWFKNRTKLPALMTGLVTGGFLFAYVIRDSYGGSMVLSDGIEKTIMGINLGVFGFGLAVLLALAAISLRRD